MKYLAILLGVLFCAIQAYGADSDCGTVLPGESCWPSDKIAAYCGGADKDLQTCIDDGDLAGGGGAPVGAYYITTTPDATLSNEVALDQGVYLDVTEISQPAAPGAGIARCYAKAEGDWCCIDDGSNESCTGGGTDTGPIPDCTGTELQDAAGTCITTLTELNTSLSSSIADGAHTADEVGTLTTGDLCINDGSLVNCTVNTEAELETALDALDIVTVNTDDISSSNLITILSDETGTGAACFATGPTIAGMTHTGTLTMSTTPVLETGAALTIGDGTDACITHTVSLSGANDPTVEYCDGVISFGANISTAASSLPSQCWDDQDSASETDDACVYANSTDTGAGTEDTTVTYKAQIDSEETEYMSFAGGTGTLNLGTLVAGPVNIGGTSTTAIVCDAPYYDFGEGTDPADPSDGTTRCWVANGQLCCENEVGTDSCTGGGSVTWANIETAYADHDGSLTLGDGTPASIVETYSLSGSNDPTVTYADASIVFGNANMTSYSLVGPAYLNIGETTDPSDPPDGTTRCWAANGQLCCENEGGTDSCTGAGGAETNTLTTVLTGITDDQMVIGGAGVATYDDVPDCDASGNALTYDTTANNVGCTTDIATDTELAAWTGTTNVVTVGTIATGTWSATDVGVEHGGTGRSTGTTAYSLIATGTTATGAQQTLANGATTEILVGGGASALPAWTTATGSGAPVRATSPTLVTPELGAATATSITLAESTTPTMSFDDDVATDSNEEAQIVGNAIADDNGSISLQVENNSDGVYYEGVLVKSTAGTISVQLGGNGTADYINIADNGAMTFAGVAAIDLESGTAPLTNIADDEMLMGSSAGVGAYIAMPTNGTNGCDGAGEALQYNTSTNAWDCLTGLGAGGTVDDISGDSGTTTGANITIAGGAGIGTSVSGDTLTVVTASSEENFLTSGALSCGASTAGKMQTHTTALQYCDNTATPVLRYAAYGESDGDATGLATDALAELADIATALKSGVDSTLITGTEGTNGNCAEWNADGDLVDSGGTCGGGSTSWDVNDTDGSPQTVDDTEEVQFIGTLPITVVLSADTLDHDVTIDCAEAVADGSTFGCAAYNATRFSADAGVVDIASVSGVTGADEDSVSWADVETAFGSHDAALTIGDSGQTSITHTYSNTGTDVVVTYSTGAMAVTGNLTATNLSGTNTGDQDFLDVLTVDPDAGDTDITSLGKLEFYDAGLYLDADADGVMDITSDGTLELHSNDWDISTTGEITNATFAGGGTGNTLNIRESTDCDAETDGVDDEPCFDTALNKLYICETADTCDSAGEWTDVSGSGSGAFIDADPILANNTGYDFVVGAAQINTSKVTIDGDADQVQLTVQGHSAQADSIVIIEATGGTEVINLDADGNILAQSIEDIDGPGTLWEIDSSGNITGASVATTAGATASVDFDTTDAGTANEAEIDVTCPTANDCDMTIGVNSGADSITTVAKIDTTDAGASTVQLGNPGTDHVQVAETGVMSFTIGSTAGLILPIEDSNQTVDGDIDWDTTANIIEVGVNGASTASFYPVTTYTAGDRFCTSHATTNSLDCDRQYIVTGDISDGTITQPDVNDPYTIAGDPAFPANSVWFSQNGLIFEGPDDTNEGLLTSGATTEVSWTLPNESGTILTSVSTSAGITGTTGTTLTLGDGADFTALTFDAGATDPTITVASDSMVFSNAATFTVPDNAISDEELDEGATFTWTGTQDFTSATSTFADTLDGEDIAASYAGKGLTETAGSPDTLDLVPMQTCMYIEDPTTDEELNTVFRAASALTISEIWCETDAGTAPVQIMNDDVAVNTEYSCGTSGGTATLSGDTTVVNGGILDVDIGTVATATRVSVCWEYTYD